MDRLKAQMDFLLEMDKSKLIGRQTYLANGERKENDAEHAWHLALMCLLLSEHANEKIDRLHTVTMVLIHDLVEIDAGDTYAYDEKGNEDKKQRERKAADRIFSMLPKDQGDYLRAVWEEFEEGDTPEARFARCIDRVQPTMLNSASGGRSWREHKVEASKVFKRNALSEEGSKTLWDYAVENYIEPNIKKGNIIEDRRLS